MSYKVLFVSEAVTLAHMARPIVLSNSLCSAEYEVHFASAKRFVRILDRLECPYWQIDSISTEFFLKALYRGLPIYSAAILDNYVKQDIELLKAVKPDLVIGDFRLSLALSARLFDVPFLNITNADWSPYAEDSTFPLPTLLATKYLPISPLECFFRLFQKQVFYPHLRPFNQINKKYDFGPYASYRDAICQGDFVLYADSPLVAPTESLPQNHFYIGPIYWNQKSSESAPSLALDDNKPFIVLSMGSSGDLRVISKLIKVLSAQPVQVLLLTASRLSIENLAENIIVKNFVSLDAYLPMASLVICNGGSPIAYHAHRYGVPVLGIPSNMDQYLTMRNLERAGAAIRLRSDRVSTRALNKAINLLLYKKKYRVSAAKVSTNLASYDSNLIFNDILMNIRKEAVGQKLVNN